MIIVPLIRANRAIAASLIYPDHPLQTIALSEFLSVFLPLADRDFLPKILGTTLALIYNPQFALFYIKSYNEVTTIYNKNELLLLILFNLFFWCYFKSNILI